MVLILSSNAQVAAYRYNMYSCFMQIPQGTVRTLALKPINLDEDDDDDDDAVDGQDPALLAENAKVEENNEANNNNRALVGVGAESNATSFFMSAMDDDGKGGGEAAGGNSVRSLKPWSSLGSAAAGGTQSEEGQPQGKSSSIWSQVAAIATFGRLRAQVAPAPMAGSKRLLQRSNNAAVWLVSVRKCGTVSASPPWPSHQG